jgi:glycosyltransferase involved in cell wall biosynthesis
MRILYLSPRQPWPPTSGAKLRDFHFARALGSQAELTYAFYAESGAQTPSLEQLTFCHRVIAVPQPRMYTLPGLVKGVVGRWSLPIVNYTSAAMIREIQTCMRQQRFDLIHVDSIHLAQCVEAAGTAGTPCFYNWHNIESELMQRYSAGNHAAARRLYAHITSRRLFRDETRILASGAGHLVCSERERLLLLKRAPAAPVAVIENGVEAAAYGLPPVPNPHRLLFVGSMAYHANADAAVWFAREVWPELRPHFPQWKLTLVGSNPGPEVLDLASIPGVEVTGTVPRVQPFYQEAVAAIVPLRVGGGTRLKILEAMAAGVPVVSTRLGAEGLQVTPDKELLFADRPDQWLPALRSLEEKRTQLTEAARQLVRARYDWDAIGRTLFATYGGWLKA